MRSANRHAACELRRKAATLRAAFEAAFWCEELGFYAFGLDPDKQPIRTVASNAGHCLWSGIASPSTPRASCSASSSPTVERLGHPHAVGGEPRYNPFSYQRGSVWPHDNGIIALGFRRYGFAARRRGWRATSPKPRAIS